MALEPNQVGVNEFTDLCKWGRCADDGGKSGYPWGLGGRGPAAILQCGRGDLLGIPTAGATGFAVHREKAIVYHQSTQ